MFMGRGPMGPPPPRRKEREKIENFKVLSKEDIAFVKPYILKHKKKMIIGGFWTIFNSIGGIIPPLLSRYLVDVAIPSGDPRNITIYSLIMILLYAIFFLSQYSQNRATTVAAQNVIRDIREDVFQRLIHLSMDYYDENKRGELISVVINDVNRLSRAVTMGLINFVTDIISLISILIAMLILDWPLAVFTYTLVPFILFSVRGFRTKLRKNHFQIREKVAEINANVEENVSGIKVAQSLAVEKRNVQKFNSLTDKNFKLEMKVTQNFAKMSVIMTFNSYVGMALMIGVGGFRTFSGNMSLGDLIAFVQYLPRFVGPLWNMAHLYNVFLEAGAALIHIRQYAQVINKVPEPVHPIPLPDPIQGEIQFDHVSFSYTEEPFMQDLNFIIHSKEKIGLVGETGAGKTTFISLLTRLYDVKAGKITLDGIDIRNLSNYDLRRKMAIVSQDVFLFQDTIMENIRFGRPTATDDEVMEAAKLAQSHEFITRMPEGYQTYLGNQGAGLSGGQRQLIAYARMILAQPKVAVLDEATSNIDSYTENLIQQNMRELLNDCTTIVIAHRFATLHAVDRLVLIENGKVIATGTHEELYSQSSYYHELYDKQYSKY